MMELSKSAKEGNVDENGSNENTPIIEKQIVIVKGAHATGGLSLGGTICFMIGEMIGAGTLALPNALSNSGWTGVIILCWACVVAMYNGRLLGNCWIILLERYSEYRTHVRYPFAAIAEKAVGKWMKYITIACLIATCFGMCTVFLLVTSENLHSIIQQTAGVNINICLWMVIVSVILAPLTWFASPKDFSLVAATAAIAVLLAVLLIFIRLMTSLPPEPYVSYAFPDTVNPYFLSFGAILFAFSGASTFPTIQHDMKEPQKFGIAVVVGTFIGLSVYLTISVSGYYVYGKDVGSNILYSLPNGGLRIAVEVFFIIHLICAYLIYINPIKNDGKTGKDEKLRTLSTPIWALNIGIIVIGVVVAVVSTYGAVLQLLQPNTLVPPCYVNSTAAQAVYNYVINSNANKSYVMQNTSVVL